MKFASICRKIALVMCVPMALIASTPSFAGVILSPVSASTNLAWSVGEEDAINQSGLSANFSSGITNFSEYVASNPTHDLTGPGNTWAAASADLPGNLDFELGGLFSIEQTALWTSINGFGVSSFDIIVASLADFSDATLIGSFSAIETIFPFEVGVQVFDTSAQGRYVRLRINSNHGQGALGVNLGEVAFNVEPIPGPSGLALALLGLSFLSLQYRTRKAKVTTS